MKRNIIDKIISAFNPKAGLKRDYARYKSEMLENIKDSGYGYHGANSYRKSTIGWMYRGGSHKEDIEDNISILRQRARDLYMGGSSLSTGAVKTMRTNVVGVGLKLKSTIDRKYLNLSEETADKIERDIEREFDLWAENTNCDLQRLDTFTELQQLVFLNWLISGDVIATLPVTKRKNSVYDLRINLVEADRLCTPDSELLNTSIIEGVEHNENGEVIAYHIAKHHPLETTSTVHEWQRVEAYGNKTGRRNVLHIMNRERIGQCRGIPFVAPIIEDLKQLSRYTEAELMAAVISGMYTIFIEHSTEGEGEPLGSVIDEKQQIDRSDEKSIELGNGLIMDLEPGAKANATNPGRPNAQFDAFTTSISRYIGAALEIPYEILLKHFSSSYSASRGALLEYFKSVKMYRAWLTNDFCQPIFEEWLSEAVAKGRIKAPGFFRDPAIKAAYCKAEWNGPSTGQLDPLKEVNAAEKRVQNGFSTRARETVELTGMEYNRNIEQLKREENQLKEVKKVGTEK